MLADAELARIRGRHREFKTVDGWSYCSLCNQAPWPCDASRLLAERDALAARVTLLEGALRLIVAADNPTAPQTTGAMRRLARSALVIAPAPPTGAT